MKKRFTKLLSICLIITMTFILSLNVVIAESAPSKITVKRAEVLSDLVTNHDHGFTIFTTSDGKIIYCMDVDKKPLSSGQTATAVGNGDAGLLYLLENSYPNKSIMGDDEGDKYITQAAVWWYLDEGKLSNEFKNATKATDRYQLVPKYIKPLVEKARAAKANGYKQKQPSMTVTNTTNTLSLTKDGKYYESKYISAALVNAKTYNVTVSGAKAQLVSENGKTKTTFNSSERFKVRVLASDVKSKTNLTLDFKTSGTIKTAKIFKTSDSAYQRVVGLYDDEVVIEKTANLSINPKLSCVYVDGKYYGKNGNEVDEKQYKKECKPSCEYVDGKYYGKDGNVVDEKTYRKECKPSCEIVDNKYYGKDGNIVDEKTFKKECNPSCQYTDDKYYDKDGNEVSKEEFDRLCGQIVEVPNTSSNVSPLLITLGLLVIVAGSGVIAYRNKKLNSQI